MGNIPSSKALMPLDEEERELMRAEKLGHLKPMALRKKEKLKKQLQRAAQKAIAARTMISIKIPVTDLTLLKQEATQKGLRYQSLLNSILHQYVTGHLRAA